MSVPVDRMARIPDRLLWTPHRSNAKRAARAQGLAEWCEREGIRPTFAELEQERQRRSEKENT
ncbi:hypothetical protein ACMYYO_13135 [Dermacoccaceae bacterium W4C1]